MNSDKRCEWCHQQILSFFGSHFCSITQSLVVGEILGADDIKNQSHYQSENDPCGLREAIKVIEVMLTYIASGQRNGNKAKAQDLRKAIWYLEREISKLSKTSV